MLERLRGIQSRERWADREMATRLGIARSTWTEIKNGRLPLSERVQMQAARAFPELLGDLLTSLTLSNGLQTPVEAA